MLGSFGRNFGAGMSGGIAYVYDPTKLLPLLSNRELIELHEGDRATAELEFAKMNPPEWPPFGCECYAFRTKENRERGMAASAERAVFLGWDDNVTNGTVVGLIPYGFELQDIPISEVVTATTVKCHEE